MPYNRIADPLLDIGKPGRSTDWKKFRDNQDYFDSAITTLQRQTNITHQDIRDHFTGSAIDTTNLWEEMVSAGNVTLVSEHSAQFTAGSAGAFQGLAARTIRQRIVKSHDYIAFVNVRVKRTGVDSDTYIIGWNDNALADMGIFDDTTDCVAIVIQDAAGESGGWIAITTNGGSQSEVGPFGTATNWNEIRLEFTCSATAGNRKVDVYLNDVLEGTMATDANMPSATLRPVVGLESNGASSRTMLVDYVEFGFLSVPTAA